MHNNSKNNHNIIVPEPLFRRIFFSIYSYTAIFCLFGIFSVSYHSCFNGSLSTLEKRYQFSSSTGGLIMITDNVATVLTNLIIGYYGKTAHKPRWMSIGCAVTGLSVMLTALPYFIYGPAQQDDLERAKNITLAKTSRDEMCHLTAELEDCTEQSSAKTMTMVAVLIFGASNFFRGFGTSIYFTYGTPYLDDNISHRKMPAFFAFIFSMRIFGAPLGFYLTSFSMRYYENPFLAPEGLTEKDPRWIGAWWIGFIISGVAMLLLAIPLSLFPREFKKYPKQQECHDDDAEQEVHDQIDEQTIVRANDSSGFHSSKRYAALAGATATATTDHHNHDDDDDHHHHHHDKPKNMSLKELPGEMYQIATNPIIACHLAGNLFRGIGLIGHFVFQTKYYEAQFRQSASKASLISGTTGILSKIIGVQLGGLLITFMKPGPRILTTCIFLVEATSVLTLLLASTVQGPNPIMAGTSLMPNGMLDLSNDCNQECHCGVKNYQPVCDPTHGTAYFSPCHAGCKQTLQVANSSTSFAECSCLFDKLGQRALTSRHSERCPPDTNNLIRYATIIAIGGMISGSSRPGNMVTFFRSVSQDQKSLAVAMAGFWHSLFVSIPYPLIYGKIFDSSCIVWSKTCDKRGNCWLYDTNRLRVVFHTVSIALIAIGSIFDLIMIFLSPRLQNLYGDLEFGKKKKKSPSRKAMSSIKSHEGDGLFSGSKMAKAVDNVVNGTSGSKKSPESDKQHLESSL